MDNKLLRGKCGFAAVSKIRSTPTNNDTLISGVVISHEDRTTRQRTVTRHRHKL